MKKLLTFVLASMFLLSACGAADDGHDHADGTGVEIHDPWARSAALGDNTAAYMLVHNHSTSEDAIVGASTDVAESAEIHLSQIDANGVMEMIHQDSVALPADTELEFKPGSYHIMLIGLKQDLKKGDEITVTLHFQTHEDIVVTIPVYDAAEMGGEGMDMDMHDDMHEETPAP
ncbi:MAG: copper chaperone PCu(A)C [Anaerolineales bacterium]|nr:copper chaperone PCu(A)C [Anaerolineales bacterium]